MPVIESSESPALKDLWITDARRTGLPDYPHGGYACARVSLERRKPQLLNEPSYPSYGEAEVTIIDES